MTIYLPARTIKKLKNNSKPFCLLSKELQGALQDAYQKSAGMFYLNYDGDWRRKGTCDQLRPSVVYRLATDADVTPGIKPRVFASIVPLITFLDKCGTNKFRAIVTLMDGTKTTSDYIVIDIMNLFIDATTGVAPRVSAIEVIALLPKVSSVTIPA